MRQTDHHVLRWIVLAVLILLCALYFVLPPVNAFVNHIASVLSSADVDAVIDLIRSFGPWAMAVSFLLMVFQSVIAPLPAFLITFANAAVFGWWQGALLSWSSAMTGAALCFLISRALGRDAVEKIAGQGTLKSVEGYFEKYGSRTILVCRLLPFVSFDAVSYFAGLTPMRFWPFFPGHRPRPAACDRDLFLCRRDAHGRCALLCDRAAVHLRIEHRGDDRQTDL